MRAFTLVELLVSIGIIALLLALLVPALGKSLQTADATVSLSNLRGIGETIELYLARYDMTYPIASEDEVYSWCGDAIRIQFGHWTMAHNWPSVLEPIAPWTEHYAQCLSPGAERTLRDPTCARPPSYEYSWSFIARPQLWSGDAPADEALLRPTRAAEVRYPTQKVLMWDWEMPYLSRKLQYQGPDLVERTPMLFPDGHTAIRVPAAATPPVPNPFVTAVVGQKRLHNTADGVHGRDYTE